MLMPVEELKMAVERNQESMVAYEKRKRELLCNTLEQQKMVQSVIQELSEAVINIDKRREAAEMQLGMVEQHLPLTTETWMKRPGGRPYIFSGPTTHWTMLSRTSLPIISCRIAPSIYLIAFRSSWGW